MIYSMTGFGQGEAANEQWLVKVEMKSFNHRYLDLNVRLPRSFQMLEETIRQIVGDHVKRGHLEIYVNIEELRQSDRIVRIDKSILKALYSQWKELQETFPLPDLTFDHVLQIPDLVQIDEPEIDRDDLTEVVKQATLKSVQHLNLMRSNEGEKLATDLKDKLATLVAMVQQISGHATKVVDNYRTRLISRLDELLTGTSLTDERFEAEVAIFADRSSIDEEIVRLGSHLAQFEQIFSEATPIGRKLDFLIQELNREINTVGSKANDLQITQLVVEFKSELEKIREQVQNLE